jgi:hypothetical protein
MTLLIDISNTLDIPRLIYLIMALTVNVIFSIAAATIYFNAQDNVKISKGMI